MSSTIWTKSSNCCSCWPERFKIHSSFIEGDSAVQTAATHPLWVISKMHKFCVYYNTAKMEFVKFLIIFEGVLQWLIGPK